jgi:TonB family protein
LLTTEKTFDIQSNDWRNFMLVYVLLLAAATPETVYKPEVANPYTECPDGTMVANVINCPQLESPSLPQAEEVPLSEALKTYPRATIPVTNPGSWVSTDDYPSSALREEREGTSGFSLAVGADGRVLSCSITASSGSADLDAATCANITKRARFYPATDKKGRPILASYANRVTWRIPQDGYDDYAVAAYESVSYPRPPVPVRYLRAPQVEDFPVSAINAGWAGTGLVALTIDELGAVSDCVVSKTSGFADFDDASCPFARSKWTFNPALDFDGTPTKGRIEEYIRWYPEPSVDDTFFKEQPRRPNANVFKDPGKVMLQFELNSKGQPLNCKTTAQGLETMLQEIGGNIFNICKMFSEPGMVAFEPFADAAGQPASKKIMIEITLKHPSAGDNAD